MCKIFPGLLTAMAIVVFPQVLPAQESNKAEKTKKPLPAAARLFQRLKAADTNHDGKLSKEEAPDRLKEHFDKIDANKDGQIDQEELKRAIRARMKRQRPTRAQLLRRLKAADKNQDGKLSKQEAPEQLKKHFDKIDANKDGQIDAEELKAAIKKIAKRQTSPAAEILERLKAADKNQDGKLSKQEAPDRLKEHFDRIDANGDGQLDAEELKRVLKRLAGKRRQP